MNIENLTINTIRVLSAESVQKANSGHPGLPLGAAPMAYTLWSKVMAHNPKNPSWINRDRFILSAGHGSMLLYSLLHLFDYGLTIEDLKNFRQIDSPTPGHPEYKYTKGVESTTGPLGQGLATAVGMAMAEAHLAAKFNTDKRKIIDHYTYALVSDGCMMEGITNEASSLAGTLKLDKLIVLYDSNNISIEGDTNLAFTENVLKRYEALGWDVHYIADGNDTELILKTLEKAKQNKDKPSFIEIKTKIGYGSAREGMASAHGEPLGEENVAGLKKNLNWNYEKEFFVPEEVKSHISDLISEKEKLESEWNEQYRLYKEENPDLARDLESFMNQDIPKEFLDSDEFYAFEKDLATRQSSGISLNRLFEKMPNLFGGAADLGSSTKTFLEKSDSFSSTNYKGSNLHFGVREHAMAAASNGIALHGGLLPYCSTFLIFSDYLKPSLRLSALMHQRVIYVFTHDSIGLGEDGPTHQPIGQLTMLRAIPNMSVFRPCDAKETAAAWSYAVQRTEGPTSLALTRQKLPNLKETGKEALRGGYVLKDLGENIDIILMASGSEVSLIYEAAEIIYKENFGVRVVSMPCHEAFDSQDEDYKEYVLPNRIRTRMSVEAASTLSWHKYIGLDGKAYGIDQFGASAPAKDVFEKFGFTASNIAAEALSLLKSKN